VTRTVLRSLRAIKGAHAQSALLGVAAVAVIGGLVAGPATALVGTGPAPVTTVTDAPTTAAKPATKPAAKTTKPAAQSTAKPGAKPAARTAGKPAPVKRSIKHDPALQPNGYYCGPAATRIALSALKKAPSQDRLAKELGTTRAGTNSVDDITRVLNRELGANRYHATKISNEKATARQVAKLRADIVAAIAKGEPVVANIAGAVTDNAGARHAYMGGHYLTVVGYENNGKTVRITDPADRMGGNTYKMSITKLADWVASRGYSS